MLKKMLYFPPQFVTYPTERNVEINQEGQAESLPCKLEVNAQISDG
jgi:hypothetical protein